MKTFAIASLLLVTTIAQNWAQDVPPGVTYKRASRKVNAAAKARLEGVIAEPGTAQTAYPRSTIIVGPTLWMTLESSATKAMNEAAPIVFVIPRSKPIAASGKKMSTEAQRAEFWTTLWKVHGELTGARVRKAKAAELAYYWATIPSAIVEPIFIVDTGAKRFVVDVSEEVDGGVVWIDLVGDVAALGARSHE